MSSIAVVKPPCDKREYRIVHLSNALTAILVHDPQIFPQHEEADVDDDSEDAEEEEEDDDDDDDEEEEDEDSGDEEDDEDMEDPEMGEKQSKSKSSTSFKKAAAAMCVGVGSFADPMDAQGLAHFLEHMLFMGSSEFTNENEFDSFLSKHGGSTNAYTEAEHTCFYFDVNRKFLKPALHRFSQFFISPLVKAEAIEREVQAVDSEFCQVLQSDSCRLQQLQCYTAHVGHPFNRFTWGNKKSLMEPISKGVDIREKLLTFFKYYYLGGNMKLAVIGGESLDTLEEWVKELFHKVRNGNVEKLSTHLVGAIWEFGKVFRTKAVRDHNSVTLTWPLPCLDKEYLKKPEDYLSHLIGHEGKGSLFSLLKAKGLASSMFAGVSDDGLDRNSIGFMFTVSIELTNMGLEKVFEVIGFVYQYLKLLREIGQQEWVFKELQDIGNIDFRFVEEQSQDDYAAFLSANLLKFSEEHVIYGVYALEIWDPKLVEYILSFLQPQNMRVDILTSSFDHNVPDVKYEPWFDVPYVIESIPESFMEEWQSLRSLNNALHLPSKNEFIPRDFTIKSAGGGKNIMDYIHPKCVFDDSMIRVWHKLDKIFSVPRANAYFLINLKDSYKDVRAAVLSELYVNLLRDALNETLYQATVSSLQTKLFTVRDMFELKIYGFNEKLPVLASKVINFLTAFIPTEDRFKVVKEDMMRAYLNTNMKPLKHSSYLRLQTLQERSWHVDDKYSCLLTVSLSDLITFISLIFSEVNIEALLHGNITEEEAVAVANIIKSGFSAKATPSAKKNNERVLKLPHGANIVRNAMVKNKAEENSVVELYFQIAQDFGRDSIRAIVIADLFEEIVREPCFNQLRTKEQLGYVVDCGVRMTYRVQGFCFRVQSAKYAPPYLQQRIDAFVLSVSKILNEMDDKEFEGYKQALINKKMEKDPSLIDETNRHWDQITEKRYLFEMLNLEADQLTSIQKKEVIDWYKKYLSSTSDNCRRLSIHIWGNNAQKLLSEPELQELADSTSNSKIDILNKHFYPALC